MRQWDRLCARAARRLCSCRIVTLHVVCGLSLLRDVLPCRALPSLSLPAADAVARVHATAREQPRAHGAHQEGAEATCHLSRRLHQDCLGELQGDLRNVRRAAQRFTCPRSRPCALFHSLLTATRSADVALPLVLGGKGVPLTRGWQLLTALLWPVLSRLVDSGVKWFYCLCDPHGWC